MICWETMMFWLHDFSLLIIIKATQHNLVYLVSFCTRNLCRVGKWIKSKVKFFWITHEDGAISAWDIGQLLPLANSILSSNLNESQRRNNSEGRHYPEKLKGNYTDILFGTKEASPDRVRVFSCHRHMLLLLFSIAAHFMTSHESEITQDLNIGQAFNY